MAYLNSASSDEKIDEKVTLNDEIENPTASSEESLEETTTAPELEDGGARAWLQVVGSFLVFGNIWGFTFAFGSFQSFFELHYLTSVSPSTISWIGTMQIFLLIVGGVLSGPLFDLGYFRTMLLTGAFVETLGVFMMSLCKEYYQLFLAQGVLMGLGCGLLYIPGLALVGRSFKKNRALAMSITTCGAPTGGVIYTLIFSQLISHNSFASTVRVMGYVMLGTYLISFPLILFRVKNIGTLAAGTKRKLLDLAAFRDLPFVWYTSSNFMVFLGYMVPFNYIASYGQQRLNMSLSGALYVSMVSQASSIVGRLVAGYTARKIGVMIPWIFCAATAGILCIGWIGVRDVDSFYIFSALYGCLSGALVPLPPSVFPVVCTDPKVLGARLGMAQGIGAVASLIGSPIGGSLIKGGSSYIGLQLFSGLAEIAGACNLVALWVLLAKRRGMGKFI